MRVVVLGGCGGMGNEAARDLLTNPSWLSLPGEG